jgi:hypothetical protein
VVMPGSATISTVPSPRWRWPRSIRSSSEAMVRLSARTASRPSVRWRCSVEGFLPKETESARARQRVLRCRTGPAADAQC